MICSVLSSNVDIMTAHEGVGQGKAGQGKA